MDAVNELLTNRKAVFTEFLKKFLKAHIVMKQIADNKRRDIAFKVGDLVMVKLRPHKQSSVFGPQLVPSKLAKRFYDSFQIIDLIGKIAYKLQFFKGARIHQVFHCFVLNPFYQSPSDNNPTPLPLPIDMARKPVTVSTRSNPSRL